MANANITQTQKSLLISCVLHATAIGAFIAISNHKEIPIEKTTTVRVTSFQEEHTSMPQKKEEPKKSKINPSQTKEVNKPVYKEIQNTQTENPIKQEESQVVEKYTAVPTAHKQQPQEKKDETAEYIQTNIAKIREAIARYKKYPPLAVKMGCEGVCFVSFKLSPSGDINEIKIAKSSGFSTLDKSSIQTVENAASDMPKPHKMVTITVPIEYKLD